MSNHTLYTDKDCHVLHQEGKECPVCDLGLCFCKVCNEFEAGLDNPCIPKNQTKEPLAKS